MHYTSSAIRWSMYSHLIKYCLGPSVKKIVANVLCSARITQCHVVKKQTNFLSDQAPPWKYVGLLNCYQFQWVMNGLQRYSTTQMSLIKPQRSHYVKVFFKKNNHLAIAVVLSMRQEKYVCIYVNLFKCYYEVTLFYLLISG